MPKKKSPENFFRRAREKDSEINKEIVNGTEIQKHLEDKTAKNYARALDLWNGKSTALGLCAFSQKPTEFPSHVK